MKNIYTTKQKLLFEIEQLPNSYILELQNFIHYLQFKRVHTPISLNSGITLQPEDDPILRACGLIDVSPFSETIDNTLYDVL